MLKYPFYFEKNAKAWGSLAAILDALELSKLPLLSRFSELGESILN
jgi:hypothetical protein